LEFGNCAIVGQTTTMVFFLGKNYPLILGIKLVFIGDLLLGKSKNECSHPIVIWKVIWFLLVVRAI
jgi:hypothetical protein